MAKRFRVAAALALVLMGCGERQAEPADQAQQGMATATREVAGADAAVTAPPASSAPLRTGLAFIAYSYRLSFEIPARKLDAVQKSHTAACEALGPTRCQLLNASRSAANADAIEASLELRIAPADAKAFQARLESSTDAAGGRLLGNTMTGEDITRQTTDADAAVKAKRTLRDRLQTLLERRDGRLADLLAVERALSATQQELDAATGLSAVLHQRIDFSTMSISYRSERALGSATERPLADAWANLSLMLARSLATLLFIIVAGAPWALVAVLVFVGLRALHRRRRASKADAPPPTL